MDKKFIDQTKDKAAENFARGAARFHDIAGDDIFDRPKEKPAAAMTAAQRFEYMLGD